MKPLNKKLFISSVLVALTVSCAFLYHKKETQQLSPLALRLMNSFPTTEEQVSQYVSDTLSWFDKESFKFAEVSPQHRNYENTIGHWDQIGKVLLERMITLRSLSILQAPKEAQQAAEKGFLTIQSHLFEKLSNTPQIPFGMISFLEVAKGKELNTSQWHSVSQLANSINSQWFPLMYQRKIDTLKSEIAQQPQTEFHHRLGDAKNKLLTKKDDSFTLLNFNVCFLPGHLPLLYGGVTPWHLRVEKVADRILQLDADIVCLQEVFEEQSADRLYELLKNKYSHFYTQIGAKHFGFSKESAGLGSGLFVASKIPLDQPRYQAFEDSSDYMKRGFFHCKISKGGEEFAHIYTTHLEAFDQAPGPEYRKKQLQQIVQEMQKNHLSTSEHAVVLCGDLNIPHLSKEPAEEFMTEHFKDSYSKIYKEVTMKNKTYVDLTELWWKARLDSKKFIPLPQILDYALLWKSSVTQKKRSVSKRFEIFTASISMNDLNNPVDALSDHNAEISLIKSFSN